MMTSRALAPLLGAALLSTAWACVERREKITWDLETPPDGAEFEPVADALVNACGSLDCHGQPGRNLRLYGVNGLRLSSTLQENVQQFQDPYLAGIATTEREYEASYQSIVGLEPEMMDAVVFEGGADVDRLSLVRKAVGLERHKGGKNMHFGDPLDTCLASWLKASVDTIACENSFPERPTFGP